MNPLSPHTRLRSLYNKYLYLDDKAYYDKKRFFEQNESDIKNMKLSDALWIESGYLQALFMTNDYGKFCKHSQNFLEKLIFHNISYFNEEQLFEKILHQRSAAFYQLKDYEQSIHNAKELLKINPHRKDTRKILYYALRSSHKKALKAVKAGLMVFFIFSGVLLMFHQIFILSFRPDLNMWFIKLMAGICIPIFLTLMGVKFGIYLKSYLQIKKFVKKKNQTN
jgi:tetratricopeptide (TPR) repeat protein